VGNKCFVHPFCLVTTGLMVEKDMFFFLLFIGLAYYQSKKDIVFRFII
jgi:hypothetical protein